MRSYCSKCLSWFRVKIAHGVSYLSAWLLFLPFPLRNQFFPFFGTILINIINPPPQCPKFHWIHYFPHIMWPIAIPFLAIILTASTNIITGVSNKWILRDEPSMIFNDDWSHEELDTALLAEWALPNPDASIAVPDSNLPISFDDWAYQLDGGELVSDCSTHTTSRTRSKRDEDTCPAPEPEEDRRICETDLYPIALCCLGPVAFNFVIVHRCSLCRWSSIPKCCSRLIACIDSALLDTCALSSNIYCCQSLDVDVSFSFTRPGDLFICQYRFRPYPFPAVMLDDSPASMTKAKR